MTHDKIEVCVRKICEDVAELPDRTSPPDRPDALLVAQSELESILRDRLLTLVSTPNVYDVLAKYYGNDWMLDTTSQAIAARVRRMEAALA